MSALSRTARTAGCRGWPRRKKATSARPTTCPRLDPPDSYPRKVRQRSAKTARSSASQHPDLRLCTPSRTPLADFASRGLGVRVPLAPPQQQVGRTRFSSGSPAVLGMPWPRTPVGFWAHSAGAASVRAATAVGRPLGSTAGQRPFPLDGKGLKHVRTPPKYCSTPTGRSESCSMTCSVSSKFR